MTEYIDDYDDMTVDEVTAAVDSGDFALAELREILAYERDHKDRVTVTRHLDGEIEALEVLDEMEDAVDDLEGAGGPLTDAGGDLDTDDVDAEEVAQEATDALNAADPDLPRGFAHSPDEVTDETHPHGIPEETPLDGRVHVRVSAPRPGHTAGYHFESARDRKTVPLNRRVYRALDNGNLSRVFTDR